MSGRLCIRPVGGRLVRRPTPPYEFLPDAPTEVNEHPYWYRRLAKGDVVICEMPAVTASAPSKKEKN